ncbi:MAG TPA: pyridoxal phosphate-dependent aminotransferase [Acidobacteriaceae bacterium]|jgi:aspartate/methionine/tyrosine aminotransferase|nr:pyridoxal phosphate-dependent aminotransferase [Acidobacteriaceae bacterium]
MQRWGVRFSARTEWDVAETRLARALRERRGAGRTILDLTASNPTRCGFAYDGAEILGALGDRRALAYDPDPRGMLPAREAVCGYCAERGATVRPEQVFLTTSTSEAYSWLFRLLCDAGDEVLLAQPSYPLFDFLGQIEDVRLVPYPLLYDHGWQLDFAGLRERVTPRTKAIAVVHPNNPTGHFTKAPERRELERICGEFGLALIVDEVFLDYSCAKRDTSPRGIECAEEGGTFARGEHPCLTFVLSGISKIAALSQMKAAWIVVHGPEPALNEALGRLEVVADTFLSMNAPVQCALPVWLGGAGKMQEQIRARTATNLRHLDQMLLRVPAITRLEVEAGWYAVLRVPALERDEELAVRLAEERGVSVHPGYFFGFSGDGWLVVSLLGPEGEFRPGVAGICEHFAARNC